MREEKGCKFWIVIIILAAVGLTANLTVLARNGDLDPAFGSGGKIITDFAGGSDYGRSLVVQADGKILIAGVSDSHAAWRAITPTAAPTRALAAGARSSFNWTRR